MNLTQKPRAAARTMTVVLVVIALGLAACSSDNPSTKRSTTTTTAAPTTTVDPKDKAPQSPKASPEAAVSAVLTAEKAGDHAASFAVLSDSARRVYKDLPEWVDRRTELPPITGFTIEKTDGQQVIALVQHQPGLDPFIGLSAAEERQTWKVQRSGKGWLADADPEVDYVLPSDAKAKAAALAWVSAVQACDEKPALSMQALPTLYGNSSAIAKLCGAKGKPTADDAANLEAGPASADIVAQYSTDALVWARVVRVTISGIFLNVALAPIGDVWKVMGVSD